MSWINKILPSISTSSIGGKNKSSVPEGLWKKCPRCDQTLYRGDLERNLEVCPKCDHHMRITARRRIELFLDPEGQEELLDDIAPVDILKFKDLKKYKDRLSAAQKKTGEKDALIVFRGTVSDTELIAVAFEFGFIGGSMGAVVGEKFTQAVNVCVGNKLPLVCFSTSGGARMQEALVSLMQMAKTAAAIARMRENRLPFISVLVDPVYGGVSASLAMMGDINIAEPNALVGFTGPDVIRQTVRVKLPDGFQRSEFLLEHGAIDMIVHRKQLRNRIVSLIRKLMYDRNAAPQPAPEPKPEAETLGGVAELAAVAVSGDAADAAAITQSDPGVAAASPQALESGEASLTADTEPSDDALKTKPLTDSAEATPVPPSDDTSAAASAPPSQPQATVDAEEKNEEEIAGRGDGGDGGDEDVAGEVAVETEREQGKADGNSGPRPAADQPTDSGVEEDHGAADQQLNDTDRSSGLSKEGNQANVKTETTEGQDETGSDSAKKGH